MCRCGSPMLLGGVRPFAGVLLFCELQYYPLRIKPHRRILPNANGSAKCSRLVLQNCALSASGSSDWLMQMMLSASGTNTRDQFNLPRNSMQQCYIRPSFGRPRSCSCSISCERRCRDFTSSLLRQTQPMLFTISQKHKNVRPKAP